MTKRVAQVQRFVTNGARVAQVGTKCYAEDKAGERWLEPALLQPLGERRVKLHAAFESSCGLPVPKQAVRVYKVGWGGR